MKRDKRSIRISGLLRWIVILIGVTILIYPSVSAYLTNKNASRTIRAYDDHVKQVAEETRQEILREAKEYNQQLLEINGYESPMTDGEGIPLSPDNYEDVLNINDLGMMGYIVIPKLGETIVIEHGTEEPVLQKAIGHLKNTSLPIGGDSTHAALSGHRGLPTASLFTNLDRLSIGDEFYVRILNQTLAYKVDQILTVLPEEMEHLAIVEGKDYVTLITCTPYGINSHRLLVRGVRVPYIYEEDLKDIMVDAERNFLQGLPMQYRHLLIGIIVIGGVIFVRWGFSKGSKARRRRHGK